MFMCRRESGGSGEGLGDRGESESGDSLKGWDPLIGARAPGTSSELVSERSVTFSSCNSPLGIILLFIFYIISTLDDVIQGTIYYQEFLSI